MTESNINRRDFIKTNAALTLGLALGTNRAGLGQSCKKDKPVRIGMIGLGGRGQSLLRNILKMENVLVPAVCDINKRCIDLSQSWITEAGQPKPEGYSKDEYSYKKLLERDDLDAVIVATYWQWHTPMSVDAMKAGKYVGVEVPAAYTLEECWQLINTYEQTKVPCMMLENWSFRSDNLAVLNMIRKDLLGKIVHCHCAHSHDCIDHWFFDHTTGKDRWPAKYLVNHNRDQYPTHQLGPVISWMDIGCGDYFDYITSTATNCFGINEHFIRRFGPDHPNAIRKYAQGDIVTTVVRTKKGKTIVINYDMQLPRPYDNRWLIQGTRGLYNEQRNAVYIVDKSPEYHQWETFPPYHEKYKHSWWKNLSKDAKGHGGTDYLELTAFFNAVRNKTQTPIDVYDSVIMSVTGPLSEESIAKGSVPVKVPDFTNGRWKTNKPAFALET